MQENVEKALNVFLGRIKKIVGSVFIVVNSVFMSYAFIGNSLFGMGVEPDTTIRIIEILVSIISLPLIFYVLKDSWVKV